MKYNENGQIVFETTGRKVYCGCEEFSCDPSEPNTVYFGYDGDIGDSEQPLTQEERLEVFDYMTARWKDWYWTGNQN